MRVNQPISQSRITAGRRWLLLLACCPVALLVFGQNAPKLQVQGFRFRVPLEYHEAPNQNQIKSLLEGKEAEPLSGGLVEMKELLLQTFDERGKLEMRIEAPQCVFDTARQTVSSPGPLRFESGNAGFTLEGRGFFWHQTNLTLIISNDIHSTVRSTRTNSFLP